ANEGTNATITVQRLGDPIGPVTAKVTITDVTTTPDDYVFKPGTRDTSFNPAGTGADFDVLAVTLQPDGKIVIGGNFTTYNGDPATSHNIMRLNSDGTRDTTFNAGGLGTDNTVRALAIQPDGKIVIGGEFTAYNGDTTTSHYVMRLNVDGSL